jgi:hypothetical protein
MSNEFFSIFNNFARHYIYSKYWNKHSHSFSESAAYPDDQIRPMTTGWWKTYWLFSEQMPVKEKLTVGEWIMFYAFFFQEKIRYFPSLLRWKILCRNSNRLGKAGSLCLYIDDIQLGLAVLKSTADDFPSPKWVTIP